MTDSKELTDWATFLAWVEAQKDDDPNTTYWGEMTDEDDHDDDGN